VRVWHQGVEGAFHISISSDRSPRHVAGEANGERTLWVGVNMMNYVFELLVYIPHPIYLSKNLQWPESSIENSTV
jgi:hypothetical protein